MLKNYPLFPLKKKIKASYKIQNFYKKKNCSKNAANRSKNLENSQTTFPTKVENFDIQITVLLFRHSFYERWAIDSRANDGPIDDRATIVFTRPAKLVTSVSKPVYRSKREMVNIVYDSSVVEER